MYKFFYLLSLVFFVSCSGGDSKDVEGTDKTDKDSLLNDDLFENDTLTIKSDYKMDNVDAKQRKEFRENLAQIEEKHGVQWDFCTCIVANDSINKAVQVPNLSDVKFNKLLDRLTTVEEKCQAFLVQNPSVTPEERARHEKKVRDCLRAAK